MVRIPRAATHLPSGVVRGSISTTTMWARHNLHLHPSADKQVALLLWTIEKRLLTFLIEMSLAAKFEQSIKVVPNVQVP